MNNYPLVTVGVGSYNNARFIVETLESIRTQTYPNIEFIIVDDRSPDNSVEVINNWIKATGSNCKFIINEVNKGFPAVCNILLKNATGKYVSWFGSDDIMMPDKIKNQVEIMEAASEDTGFVYSDVYLIDEKGELFPQTDLGRAGLDTMNMPEGWIFKELIKGDFIPAMSPLVRRSCFDVVGNYDESLSYEDWDTWLRISLKYKVKYSTYVSAKYRQHGSSMWHTRGAAFYQSTLNSHQKFLGIDSETDAVIRNRVVQLAEYIYMNNGKESQRWLKERLKIAKDMSSAVFYVSSLLGIKYQSVMGLIKKLK